MASILARIVLLACAWGMVASRSHAQEAAPSADSVKAAFLYHFGKFVGWPEGALAGDTFTIAVLGAKPVAEELRRIAPGRTVQGHPIQVREIRSIEDLGNAQILFINESQSPRLARMLEAVRGKPVLVVTDIEDGLRYGATINFTIAEQRVRFEVSLGQAKRMGLYLSSRLLDIALRVEQSGLQRDPGESRYAAL
jgi:hypothetical protein